MDCVDNSLASYLNPLLSPIPSLILSLLPSPSSPPLPLLPSPPPLPLLTLPLLFSLPRVSEFEQQLMRERELAAVAKDLSEVVKDPEIQATKVKYECLLASFSAHVKVWE